MRGYGGIWVSIRPVAVVKLRAMKPQCHILAIAHVMMLAAGLEASPAEAQRIRQAWDLSAEKWSLESRLATTPDLRAEVLAKRPDPLPVAREMWQQIGGALEQEWTLEYAAWFLRFSQNLTVATPDGAAAPAFPGETQRILDAVETHHMQSGGLVPMCNAMAGLRDPRSFALLEKIQQSHPDAKVRGVAALATSLRLKSFGDDGEVMRRRLTCLREAILASSDVDLGGITVAQVAEDELYLIRHLSKGRVAPDLSGMDSAGRPLKLSDLNGKIVMLLFWSSTMPEAEHAFEITNAAVEKFRGRPVEVLGVNLDPLEKLRSLEADNVVSWRSFSDPTGRLAKEYRVSAMPLVHVLDGERKIHYAGMPGSFAELTIDALLSESGAAPEP